MLEQQQNQFNLADEVCKVLYNAVELFKMRQEQYYGRKPFEDMLYKENSLMTMLWLKVVRTKNALEKGRFVQLLDSLSDLINYAAMFKVYLNQNGLKSLALMKGGDGDVLHTNCTHKDARQS